MNSLIYGIKLFSYITYIFPIFLIILLKTMELSELRTEIDALLARIQTIRDWL